MVAALVVGGEVAMVASANELVRLYPEFASIRIPLVVLALAFGLCVEALLFVTGILIGYIQADRIFGTSALRWVNALVALVALATLVVFATLFYIPGPPPLALLIMAALPVGATVALVLLVMRRLLGRAVAMRVELDEVV